MRSLPCRAVSAVPYIPLRSPCCLSHGRPHPYASPRRCFCSSRKLLSVNINNSTLVPGIPLNHFSSLLSGPAGAAPNVPLEEESAGGKDPNQPTKPVDKAHYGSASRRAGRNVKKPTDIPQCHLPQNYLDRNVTIGYKEAYDKLLASMQLVGANQAALEPDWPFLNAVIAELLAVRNIKNSYPDVWQEIALMVRAGLQPPAASHADAPFSAKQHLILHCPQEGSIHTLDALVTHLVCQYSADLIRIDAQDIAEIGGNYLDEPGFPPNEGLSTLGYDVHAGPHEGYLVTQDLTAEEKGEVEEEEINPRRSMPLVKTVMLQDIPDMFKGKFTPAPQHQTSGSAAKATLIKDDTRKLKLETFVESLLHACSTKRVLGRAENDRPNMDDMTDDSPGNLDSAQDSATKMKNAPSGPPPVIVLVNDYPEIYNTHNGGRVMDALHDALYERRKEGQRFLLIGTCAAKDHQLVSSRPGDGDQLWEFDTGPTKTIIVPTNEEMGKHFKAHHADRTKAINTRHLQDMIRRLASNPKQVSGVISKFRLEWTLAATQDYLEDHVWSADQVNQIATIALGCMMVEEKDMSVEHIQTAIVIAMRGNEAKRGWIAEETKKEKKRQKGSKDQLQRSNKKEIGSEAVQAKLRSQCNKHEKRLLQGVVDPSSIRTTFADVRAPKETIETLKTLTSLSLLRPDAFTYGVLATDKITGVLLYGPPGTGKTMLARAVAKESGATVLEVSGADLYNMWVGEGEKNVKAIFSLAKKLAPCIVFIDEADAILGSRGGSSNRVSHRELINQFLREWDGMGELSAFIMAATNRPYDLDEATLRRLPRRMLVDLPTEKDREAILRIHLRDEVLDSEIKVQQLAAETPLYSGSDLKNLCVAAALGCVKEEYDADIMSSSSNNTFITGDSESPFPSSPQMPSTDVRPITPANLTEANVVVQEPSSLSSPSSLPSLLQPLSTASPLKHYDSLSGALATVSSSSSALLESFTSVSEFITSMRKSATPPASTTSTAATDPNASAFSTQPVDASLVQPAPSTTSSTASVPLGSSNPEAPTTIRRSGLLPIKPSSSSKENAPTSRRILRPHHFKRALEEISASISDDMRSLTQIKKFDEKYGDRRARKGKLGGRYGFGTLNEKEREKIGESGGRVRSEQLP